MVLTRVDESQSGEFVLRELEEPHITLLEGPDGNDAVWRQLLRGSEWLFSPSQTFTFRQGRAFLNGTYTRSNNLLEFAGERPGVQGSGVTFDGFLHLDGPVAHLDMISIMTSPQLHIARIMQNLGYFSQKPLPITPGRIMNGIPIPSTFRIILTGETDSQSFGPLPATIEIGEPSVGDPNPFTLLLTTDFINAPGSLYWNSFTRGRPGWSWLECEIALPADRQALLTIVGDQQTVPGWFSLSRGEETGGLLVSTCGDSGTLCLTVEDGRIAGGIQASGMSTLRQSSTYFARFTGHALSSMLGSREK